MARVAVGTQKESPAERRRREAREAAAAAAADSGPARRGEDDEQQPATPAPALAVEPVAAELPAQQPSAAAEPVSSPAEATVEIIDPNAEPADQLAVCERGIHGAKARWTARMQGATDDFIEEAGPYLAWVHQKKLYKLMKDKDGKEYRSFARYLREEHGLPERTGYRITQTIPLLRALEAAGHPLPDLSARQVAVLHPVRIQHGKDAVIRVWRTAWETKKGPLPTPDELEKAKVLLGLMTKPDPEEGKRELTSAADPGAAVEKATKLLVPETVREAVRKDPEQVRQLVRVLSTALTEAGVPVD